MTDGHQLVESKFKMKIITASLLIAASTSPFAAETTLVCTRLSGYGGNLSYVVVIDPDKRSMSVDGVALKDVTLEGTEFIGISEKRRRADSYSVDRVSMKFGHVGGQYTVRDNDIRIEGKCEKESAKF